MEFMLPDIYTMNDKIGTLYLVATPIGNLEDITLRALRILKEVDGILCEDTRQTLKLLNHFEIKNKLSAYHKFNEKEEVNKIINRLENGEDLALVSDAGLPLISDPGSILVKECRVANIPITVVPGANAALSALQLSGLDTTRFTFFGFPPKNKKDRKRFLNEVLNCHNTAIMYESPHQLIKTLEEFNKIDPEREIVISREITKRYEETISGNAELLLENFKEHPPKGEFVIIIDKSEIENIPILNNDISVSDLVDSLISEGLNEKEAIKRAASLKGLKKRDVYKEIKIEKND